MVHIWYHNGTSRSWWVQGVQFANFHTNGSCQSCGYHYQWTVTIKHLHVLDYLYHGNQFNCHYRYQSSIKRPQRKEIYQVLFDIINDTKTQNVCMSHLRGYLLLLHANIHAILNYVQIFSCTCGPIECDINLWNMPYPSVYKKCSTELTAATSMTFITGLRAPPSRLPVSPAGISLGMCPANERRCYNVTTSLIGWVHT